MSQKLDIELERMKLDVILENIKLNLIAAKQMTINELRDLLSSEIIQNDEERKNLMHQADYLVNKLNLCESTIRYIKEMIELYENN